MSVMCATMYEGHPMLPLCRSSDETLPLESSPNFTDKDIGEPILDVILHPGDMLYFPRGTIHQVGACTSLVLHCSVPCDHNYPALTLVCAAAANSSIKHCIHNFRVTSNIHKFDFCASIC